MALPHRAWSKGLDRPGSIIGRNMSNGLDPRQFRDHVIKPTLLYLGERYASPSAVNLLLGTMAAESGGRWLRQRIELEAGDWAVGPGHGIYSMEPATEGSLWENYLRYRMQWGRIGQLVRRLICEKPPAPHLLISDLRYATAMARIKYWKDPDSLPNANDIAGLARYWKRVYNTRLGAGTPEFFEECWFLLIEPSIGPI